MEAEGWASLWDRDLVGRLEGRTQAPVVTRTTVATASPSTLCGHMCRPSAQTPTLHCTRALPHWLLKGPPGHTCGTEDPPTQLQPAGLMTSAHMGPPTLKCMFSQSWGPVDSSRGHTWKKPAAMGPAAIVSPGAILPITGLGAAAALCKGAGNPEGQVRTPGHFLPGVCPLLSAGGWPHGTASWHWSVSTLGLSA